LGAFPLEWAVVLLILIMLAPIPFAAISYGYFM
jgi:hypothetical protein